MRVLILVGVVSASIFACDSEAEGDPTPIELADASSHHDVGKADGPGDGDGGVAPDGTPDAAPRSGLAVLGYDSHDIEQVNFEVIGDRQDGLKVPRDLAFNPSKPGELWVVNRRDDSTSTFFDMAMDDPDPASRHLIDPYALHFMEEVSSIAFGEPEIFATCQESRNTYDNQAPPNDFMGPALWSSDFEIYARTNPDAVDAQGFDLGSHLDMLHESPLCMGIEWEVDNKYFVFEGMTGSIARADFRSDHGPGFDDHSDGIMERFAVGEVQRVPDVPSHLYYDFRAERLYIADTGNSRIAALNPMTGQRGQALRVIEPGTQLYLMEGFDPVETVFEHEDLVLPSGIARFGEHLFISDNETGRIWAITLQGEVVDYLDTGLPAGALMGLEFDDDGVLYGVDARNNQLWRISPRE